MRTGLLLRAAHALSPSARSTLKGIGGPCLKECVESGPRWEDLELGKKRARWEQIKREQDKQREDDEGVECKDEEKRKKEEEEEEERIGRREKEKVIWDGRTVSKAYNLVKFSTNVNFDGQIAANHRSKGLGLEEVTAIGPGIGPAAIPAPLTSLPPPPASLPAHPSKHQAPLPMGVTPLQQSHPVLNPPPSTHLKPHPSCFQTIWGWDLDLGLVRGPQLGMVTSADEMNGGEDGHPPGEEAEGCKVAGGDSIIPK
ncbi:hypothetical protein NLI96_g9090 [Meripilus lineatus]|uniref:Uncharacterized protein n=1 Tax=Meripilus lineatus TaxID=2056292 RepID=A0AAD5UYE2_9APHY|nr:hypothetical protein NLI96_g9090 [Physisporinus lineatus]